MDTAPIRSLLGNPLLPPPVDPPRLQAAAAAQAAYEREPSLEHTIWYGRRVAYCLDLPRALAIFSAGIEQFPQAYELYRHRGHRWISTRRFAAAISDFERAAALAADHPPTLEPDGIPNQRNQPLTTGHFNIWYHLGLAHYLSGNYTAARAAYEACLTRYVTNDDGRVATSDWLYMTYQRLGDLPAAHALLNAIHPQMDIVEDHAYHRRLLLYKGIGTPEELLNPPSNSDPDEAALTLVTQGYGVGNWYAQRGDTQTALLIFARMLQTTSWAAFGYIAAEADLARMSAASGILVRDEE
jgi:tetratricopeptide (TPR) repeat protein